MRSHGPIARNQSLIVTYVSTYTGGAVILIHEESLASVTGATNHNERIPVMNLAIIHRNQQ